MAPPQQTLRVVAADDSAVMRRVLGKIFADPALRPPGTHDIAFDLCAVVAGGASCIQAVRAHQPSAVILDLEMPHMSGMEVLSALHHEFPQLPVIMCSAYTARGAAATLEALARGAADYVTKPATLHDPIAAMQALSQQLLPRIVALASRSSHRLLRPEPLHAELGQPRRTALPEILGIGVSTGGPAALEHLLPRLPAHFPAPVLISQHMPRLFTSVLAQRLSANSALHVREAEHGMRISRGEVLLAPGDQHMEVARDSFGIPRIVLHQRGPHTQCRPSVDLLFHSLAATYGPAALALVMTGMGADGLEGARSVVTSGGAVLAQDEQSSAIWGMPGRVAEAGLASAIVALDRLHLELADRFRPLAKVPYRTRSLEVSTHAVQ